MIPVLRLCLLLLISSVLFAQVERGNITGSVTDPSGAAVAGASVTVVNVATNSTVTAQTTAAGAYNVPSLPSGTYRVEISAPGFRRYVQQNVLLTAGGAVGVSPQLAIGAVNETVEVTAAVAMVQTENARVATVVQNRLVDELPLVVGGNMRTPYNLVNIAPEARGGLAIGGGQGGAWDATLDGVSTGTNRNANASEAGYNSPSVESITEFTVDTNGFKAEYGQAGGGLMSFVSKSGTNQVHGSAYDFLRNEKLDARDFFETVKSVYRQNDFGATLGGPVYIPKVYNGRNRTFFFASYEGFRNREGATASYSTIPTPEMYKGDFSRWVDSSNKVLLIYDPATTTKVGNNNVRTPFSGNLVPLDRFTAFAKSVIPYAEPVKPNAPGIERGGIYWITNNYVTNTGSNVSPQDKGSLKLDHMINQSHRLAYFMNFTRYRNEIGPGGPRGLPIPLYSGQPVKFDSDVYRLTHDWTISPTTLNHFVAGGNLFDKLAGSPNSGINWQQKGVCIKGAFDCTINFPIIEMSGYSSWGGSAWNGTEQPLWSIKEDLSHIRGQHSFKFGYSYQSQRAFGIGFQRMAGLVNFNRLGTSVPAQTANQSGSGFASFLLGQVNSARTQTKGYIRELYQYHGFYAQDDWRINRRLVLNLGLRYEFTLPPVELDDQYSDFDPTLPNPAVNGYPGALRFAGFGPGRENTRRLVPGWYKGFGPRLGMAFSVNQKTTLRAAFGRSFDKVNTVGSYGNLAGFVGQYDGFATTDQGITPAFQIDQGFPAYPLPPQINPAFQNNQNVDYWHGQELTRAPEELFWTFSINRQLTSSTVLEASYNAVVGVHLRASSLNINQTPTKYLNEFIQKYGATQALNLLRADINSTQAREAGIPIPYPSFTDPSVQQNYRTVNQALRPFPQYQTVETARRGGDHSGHSSYHAMVLKVERRYSAGLTMQWNYTLSKIFTNAESFNTEGGAVAMDQYNRGLDKALASNDQTHALKMSTIYEMPFGRGRRWMGGMHPVLDAFVGGWRIGVIQTYTSSGPVSISRNNPFPIFNGSTRPVIDTYDNWRAPIAGEKFDPAVDRFMVRSTFPTQPNDRFGNMTRNNPRLRPAPALNENVSLAKSFRIGEVLRLDFRAEAFNIFNRVRFGAGTTSLDNVNFGRVTSTSNDPRNMQMGLKLYW